MRGALVLVLVAACAEPLARAQPPRGEDAAAIESRAEDSLRADQARSRATAALLRAIASVRGNLRETRYQARTLVRPRDGLYAWDCSGMTAWFLRRAAPHALRSVGRTRPVARDFYRAIARAPSDRTRGGWQRLAHVRDARPGDVFAWLRSPISTSKVTGHVGFVIGTPVAVEGWPNAFAVRILDATRLPHQDDTRGDDGIGGFGFGTMVFVTDDAGEVQYYGWFGTTYGNDERALMPAHVVFGRPTG